MKNSLNLNLDTLKSYYNVIKAYCRNHNEKASVYYQDEQFLEYVFETATNEFDDGEKHVANEYKSPYAQVIIGTAEFLETFIEEELEEEEWNGLFIRK